MSRAPITHHLKTHPEPFAALISGAKTYEVRLNDRDFQVGDVLVLEEYLPKDEIRYGTWRLPKHPGGYGPTGRRISRVVSYLTRGGEWGLPPEICVLGFAGDPAPVEGKGEAPLNMRTFEPVPTPLSVREVTIPKALRIGVLVEREQYEQAKEAFQTRGQVAVAAPPPTPELRRPRVGDPDVVEAREAHAGPLYRVPYGEGDGWMLAERTLLEREGRILFLSSGGHTVISLLPDAPVAPLSSKAGAP